MQKEACQKNRGKNRTQEKERRKASPNLETEETIVRVPKLQSIMREWDICICKRRFPGDITTHATHANESHNDMKCNE